MRDRIKAVRKDKKLSQAKFAEVLGISTQNVINWENGRNNPSDSAIKLICKEFNVNPLWLETGEGEMFMEMSAEDEMAAYLGKMYNLPEDDPRRRIIMAMTKIPEEYWGTIREIMDITAGKK